MLQKNALLSLFIICLSAVALMAQGQSFVRSAVIDPPAMFGSGFGSTVSGVDLDGDGKVEIYSINGMTDFFTGDEIPQIIKYEKNGGQWDSVWAASFPDERQNTWGALTVGDLDGDSKLEIIWGYVNSFSTNETPPRIVVFENSGDDVLGISDGNGNYTPNAAWDMDVPASTNMRPLKWFAVDIDNDGKQEVVFAERRDYYNFGVISVDDVPDNGGGSDTWTLELTVQSEFYNRFVRSGIIDGPDGGFGGLITGMDYDEDGLMDMYAINDNWGDGANGELIPTIYKYEFDKGAWILRWSTRLPGVDYQNTWPVLVGGDWDNDGKGEVIWTPVNNFGSGNEDPPRIVVYETPGDSSDVMGIDNGDDTYSPNASWNMDVPASTSMRPFRGQMADIDGDGALEFVFTERHNYYVWGVIGVNDIPDNGDGSETWTMEANGTPDAANDYRDLAIIDNAIYLFGSGGDVRKITNDGSTYTVSDAFQAYPGWSWLSANTVDIDGDGNNEIVTGDYLSTGSASVWVLVPEADTLTGYKVADFSANTATRITNVRAGDINADGLMDFVVGFRGTDEVYRVAYNGGDITSESSYATSLLDSGVLGAEGIGQWDMMLVADIDGKGGDEVFYTGVPRGVDANTSPLVIGSYSDTLTADAGRRWDICVANGSIQLFDGSGNLQQISYEDGNWVIYPTQAGIVNGAFLTASPADIDGDGTEEIFVGNWYDAKVVVLKWVNNAWTAVEVADFSAEGGNRLNGGAVGDIDNDGLIDFVTGTRESSPNGQIFRVEYTGGDMMDPANYRGEAIDSELLATHTQYEVVNIANLDDDPELEVLYTSDYARGTATATDPQVPLVILDLQAVQTTDIADVKVDANNDAIPDNLDGTFTISGVVTSINMLASSDRFSYFIQDETGGINVTKGSEEGGGPVYEVGTILQVTGTVEQYRGLTQLSIADLNTDVVAVGTGTVPTAVELSVEALLENAEIYEGMLVKLPVVVKADGSADWPAADSDANMTINDGTGDITLRIDKDTDIDGQTEPVYPMSVVGIVTQYTSSSSVYDDGYQVSPNFYTDLTGDVPAPPSPYFYVTETTKSTFDEKTISINAHDETFTFAWEEAVDLNGDDLIYQLIVITPTSTLYLPTGGNILQEPSITLTGLEIIDALGDVSQTVQLTMRTKGNESDLVSSVDTITTTFDIVVGVDEEDLIPKEFYVDQNYPNPFNPTTTIRFGLPEAADVNLIIYDILGREVATLINSKPLNAGTHSVNFNASALASGTYVYRLSAGKKVEIKKMMLVK